MDTRATIIIMTIGRVLGPPIPEKSTRHFLINYVIIKKVHFTILMNDLEYLFY